MAARSPEGERTLGISRERETEPEPSVAASPLAPGEEVPELTDTPLVPVYLFLTEGETGPAPEGAGGPAEGPPVPPRWDGPLEVPEGDFLGGEEAAFFFFGLEALEVEGEEAATDEDDTFLFFVSSRRTVVRSSIQAGVGVFN